MVPTPLIAALGAAAGVCALGAYDPNSPIFGPVIGRGPTDRRTLYLTFDDGPSPSATEAILDTLSRERVPATFFMVGAYARRHPTIARRVGEARLQVGNHTENHVKLHRRGPGRIRRELEDAHASIADAAGAPPCVFRAPHGYRNPFVAPVARRLGYRVFGWTFGVWDSDKPGAEEIRRRARSKLRPGAIVLLHDGDGYDPEGDRRQTAAALPHIIRDARDAGYSFAPLSDLLA